MKTTASAPVMKTSRPTRVLLGALFSVLAPFTAGPSVQAQGAGSLVPAFHPAGSGGSRFVTP